jgi:hypothetical protein
MKVVNVDWRTPTCSSSIDRENPSKRPFPAPSRTPFRPDELVGHTKVAHRKPNSRTGTVINVTES